MHTSPLLARALLVVALGCTVFPTVLCAQQNLDITVRAGIDLAEKHRRDHDKEYAANPTRGRIYFLARIMEEKGETKLVKPVDAIALAKLLNKQLEAAGFHAALPGQKPEIVITVKYGKGYLNNPYSNQDGDHQITPLSNSDRVEYFQTHEKFVGYYERLVAGWQEKLVIQVRAWAYPPPPDPKQKEELLWATTMIVDDPDHRDLNLVADQMLAKGAAYFDRHVEKESEVVIHTAMLDGHVNVGPPEVVPKDTKK